MNIRRTPHRRHDGSRAWPALFALDVVMCLLGLPYLLRARSFEPKSMEVVEQASAVSPELGLFVRSLLRLVGLNWLLSVSLAATIAATRLRGGRRWAWYAHWAVAAYWFGDSTIDKVAGGRGWARGYLWAVLIAATTLLASPRVWAGLPSRCGDHDGISARVR